MNNIIFDSPLLKFHSFSVIFSIQKFHIVNLLCSYTARLGIKLQDKHPHFSHGMFIDN